MNFDDVLPSFIAEATELLREMEAGLLECTRGEASDETINLIFRTAHTIKGSAGLFSQGAAYESAKRLEHLAKSGDLTKVDAACADVEADVSQLMAELRHLR